MPSRECARREVQCADLNHLDRDKLLWSANTDADPRRARLVRDAIADCLTERQRAIVAAYFFEGRSQSEIARGLGIRQQVVHKCIYGTKRDGRMVGGALRRLAAYLEPRLRS